MFFNPGASARQSPRLSASPFRGAGWYIKVIVVALLASGALFFAVMALQPESEGEGVLVSQVPLDAGHVLAESDLTHATVSAAAKPEDAVTDLNLAVGQPLLRSLSAKTILTEGHFGTVGVPPGYAALTLTLGQTNDLLVPGESVEIWGPKPACTEAPCPMVQLCRSAHITGLVTSDPGLVDPEVTVRVSLRLPPSDVGRVLGAAESGSLHFVSASPDP